MRVGMEAHDFPAKKTWQSPAKAARYRHSRKPGRYSRYFREEAILRRWLDDVPRMGRVLDVPCGTGRWIPTVAGLGFRYVGADISRAMLHEALGAADPPAIGGLVNADAVRLPFEDGSFDCVIVWRLLHHIPDTETRRAVLCEAARVSRRKVLVSFHHPLSFTYLSKWLRRTFLGFQQGGRGITHWQLEREAGQCGLVVTETQSFRKYVSINWFACLSKVQAGAHSRARPPVREGASLESEHEQTGSGHD